MGSILHYSASVLADNPLWYWRLAEPQTGSGPPLKTADQTGNNHTGSFFNITGSQFFGQLAVVPANTVAEQLDASVLVQNTSTTSSASIQLTCHHLNVGDPFTSASFSVEFWVKPKNLSTAAQGQNMQIGGNSAISGSPGLGVGYFHFDIVSTGGVRCGIRSTDWFTSTEVPSGTFAVHRSSHVVFTYDGLNQLGRFYLDGRLAAGPKTMLRPLGPWTKFCLGSNGAVNNGAWNGHFDEVAVYQSVLQEERIKAHFDAAFTTYEQQVRKDAPKLYWRLGDASGSGPPFRDYSDNSRSGSFFGSPANFTFADPGLLHNDVDGALSGNATTYQGHVQFTGSTLEIGGTAVNNPFSVEWWTTPGKVSTGTGNTIGWGLGKFTAGISGSNGEGFAGIGVADLFTPPQLGPGFFQPGKTAHYAFCYDGTTGFIYKNGVLACRPHTMTAPSAWGSVDPFKVGVSGSWLGSVDEVAVYGYSLPSHRVMDHWKQGFNLTGSGGVPPTISAVSGNLALLTGGDFVVVSGSNMRLSSAVLVKSGTVTVSASLVSPPVSLTGSTLDFLGFYAPAVPAVGIYDVVVLNPDSTVTTASLALTYVTGGKYEAAVVADRPVLFWRLSDASGSTKTADRSNMQNTGTIVNSNPFLVYGQNSLVSRGQGDTSFAEFNPNAPVPFLIISPRGDLPATYPAQSTLDIGGTAGARSFSVEFWMNQRSGQEPYVPRSGDGGTPRVGFSHPGFLLNVNNATNGTTTVGTDSVQALTASSFLATRNVSHHIVYTFSSSFGSSTGTGKLYRNGTLIAQGTQNVPQRWTAFQFLGPVSGTFDEIAVYDYPLSADQVGNHNFLGKLYPAEDFSYPTHLQGNPNVKTYQDVSRPQQYTKSAAQPRPYQDLSYNIAKLIFEAGVSPYGAEEFFTWIVPFGAVEGAGNLDADLNSQFLFISSSSFTDGGGGGGGGGDVTAPVLSNFNPPFGNSIGENEPITFDLTDNSGQMRLIILHGSYDGVVGHEVIHDGEGFGQRNYSNGSNVRTPISGGFRYTILRDGGWPGTFTLYPFAVDTSGNENT